MWNYCNRKDKSTFFSRKRSNLKQNDDEVINLFVPKMLSIMFFHRRKICNFVLITHFMNSKMPGTQIKLIALGSADNVAKRRSCNKT